jgi:cell division protein FtsB
VSQLKKQNRELKYELDSKEQAVDKLKKDLKLSKSGEIEIELQQYIDECLRLRRLLEEVMSSPQ